MELRDQDRTLLMSVGKTGGPAFPVQEAMFEKTRPGMTLRDYFAAAALQGVLSSGKHHVEANENANRIAKDAYTYATAMLKARTA